jgi:hypothetical protein
MFCFFFDNCKIHFTSGIKSHRVKIYDRTPDLVEYYKPITKLFLGFEVLTAARMKMDVFWVVASDRLDDGGSKHL